jgi:hypothetical protein
VDTWTGTQPKRERRVQWSTIAVAIVFAVVCLLPMVLWFTDHRAGFADSLELDRLPTGSVLGHASSVTIVAVTCAAAVLVALLAAVGSARVRGDLSWRHACAAVSLAAPVVGTGVLAAILLPQLDVPANGRPPSGHLWLALALTGSLFAGVIGALLVRPGRLAEPGFAPDPDDPTDPDRAWAGLGAGVPLTTFLWPIGTAVIAVMVAISQRSLVVAMAIWCLAVVLLLLRIRGTHPRVLIDADGVRVLLGRRVRAHAQLADVLDVDVVHARPLRDFGGWGLRIGRGGSIGWVTRRGPALHVRRHYGGDMVITLDDPYQAAAVTRALLDGRTNSTQASDSAAGASPA